MITAKAHLKSLSPYSQSKHHETPKLEKESPNDYEARTWRERCNTDVDGHIFIPPMAFKNCLSEAAKFLAEKVVGRGQSTYTKHFEAGVLVVEGAKLPVTKDHVEGEWLFVPSDGVRGGGKRVNRCFPLIREWEATVNYLIFDETITEVVFRRHLEQAGQFIGIGRFRPRNNGFYGRFEVASLEWKRQ